MVRKIFFLAVAVGLLGSLIVVMPMDIVFLLPDADRYYVYCRSYDGEAMDNGIAKVVQVTDDVAQVLYSARYVDGVTAVLPSDTDVGRLLTKLRANVLSTSKCGDIVEYCCYSPVVRGGVTVDGQTVNVQIAVTDVGVYVGVPLLLGAY